MIRALLVTVGTVALLAAAPDPEPGHKVRFHQDDARGQLQVQIDEREVFVFRYGPDVDLPHYYPVRSPSGKLLTIQQTEPYPHHRSIWFADKVELSGHRPVEFYMALHSRDTNMINAPFTNRVRHVRFLPGSFAPAAPEIRSQLIWEADDGRVPVLDEHRSVRIVPETDGGYLLDMTFTLTATYGDVTFRSDAVHYAWPFVRMHPQFSVDRGGTITSSEGGINEKATNGQVAHWIDYSNTIDGKTEGLAILSHSENEHPHRWLTRDYGTFGPRRVDAKSGKPFTLRQGGSLRQRVGILVHTGDVRSGRVGEAYRRYTGELAE